MSKTRTQVTSQDITREECLVLAYLSFNTRAYHEVEAQFAARTVACHTSPCAPRCQ